MTDEQRYQWIRENMMFFSQNRITTARLSELTGEDVDKLVDDALIVGYGYGKWGRDR